MWKKLIFIFLVAILCLSFTGRTLALSYQPDLTIKYGWKYLTLGKDIINTTGQEQLAHDYIKGYKSVSYLISIYNKGESKDKFLVWGSSPNQYWDVSYYDTVGRDITKEMTSSGWTTVTLWPKEKECINLKITPKKNIPYGQEDEFFVMAKSLTDPSKADKVLVHLSVRFPEEAIEASAPQFKEPEPEIGSGSNQTLTAQPDLEYKTCQETDYLGKNIFETKDKIKKQTSQITTNAAYGPACFNLQLTNNDAFSDTFLLKGPSLIKGNWSLDYFTFSQENKININDQIASESFSLTLNPGESQIFEIQIEPAREASNGEEETFLIFAQSQNDVHKIDNVLLSIKVDLDLDKDGMSDIWEEKYNLDFHNPEDSQFDPDKDGLINVNEHFYNTDPFKKDTNEDGLWDGANCQETILHLPGLKKDNLIIAGPIFLANKEIAKGQNISFHLVGKDVDFNVKEEINNNGFVTWRIPLEQLENVGHYILETQANEMVFQENSFFVGPQGQVLDKKTNEGIKGAQIELFSCQENCCYLMNQDISDEHGFWNNFLVPSGNYQLKISKSGFKDFVSPIFYLNEDSLEHKILLSPVFSLGEKIGYILLGIVLLVILLWAISKLWPKISKKAKLVSPFQPDGQIKTEKEEDYLGDTIYNLSGEGQTKEQKIKPNEKAIFHIRIQNDGARPDKFLVRCLPVETKGWQVKFFNTLHQGNEITQDILGKGWQTGTLGSGIWKDIRLEVKALSQPLSPLTVQINIISQGNPLKIDTVKAQVELEGGPSPLTDR